MYNRRRCTWNVVNINYNLKVLVGDADECWDNYRLDLD